MLCFEKKIIPIPRSTGFTHLAPAASCWPLSLPSVLLSSSYTSLSSISWKCQAIFYLKIITFPSDQNILGQVICLSPQPSDLGISSEKISLTSSLPMWLTPPFFPPQFCSLSLQHCFFFFHSQPLPFSCLCLWFVGFTSTGITSVLYTSVSPVPKPEPGI